MRGRLALSMWRVSVRGLSCRVTLRLWTCPLLYSTAAARGDSTGAVLDLFCGADRGRVNATDHEGLLGFADFLGHLCQTQVPGVPESP